RYAHQYALRNRVIGRTVYHTDIEFKVFIVRFAEKLLEPLRIDTVHQRIHALFGYGIKVSVTVEPFLKIALLIKAVSHPDELAELFGRPTMIVCFDIF